MSNRIMFLTLYIEEYIKRIRYILCKMIQIYIHTYIYMLLLWFSFNEEDQDDDDDDDDNDEFDNSDKDGVDDTMNNDGSKYHHDDDDLPCVTVWATNLLLNEHNHASSLEATSIGAA